MSRNQENSIENGPHRQASWPGILPEKPGEAFMDFMAAIRNRHFSSDEFIGSIVRSLINNLQLGYS